MFLTRVGNTRLVKDINAGNEPSHPHSITAVGSRALFSAQDGTRGYELWQSDGTPAGTKLVKDIYPGSAVSHSAPGFLTSVGKRLFFAATAPRGRDLWSYVPR